MSKTIEHNVFLLVDIGKHRDYRLNGNLLEVLVVYGGYDKMGDPHDHDIDTIELPPGNYQIIGLLKDIPEKDLPEDVWVWIAKTMSEKNLTADTTLILKKQQ